MAKSKKGVENGNCNRTACQRSGATWYNHGSYAWYCTDCKNCIYDDWGKRSWSRDFPNKNHPMFETRAMIDDREALE